MATATSKPSVRERLLAAADELFYNEGVNTVGIDRILAHAGVAKASLYTTFGSKEELVREYVRGRDERLRARITARLSTIEDPRERILAIFDALDSRVAEGAYYGCPFIRASTDGPQNPSKARDASIDHRDWRRALFTTLATEAELPQPKDVAQQLSFLYDGASTAAAMEGNDRAPGLARDAAARLIGFESAPKKKPAARKRN